MNESIEDCYCSWCNAHLNEQKGFDHNNGTWICTECGYMSYGNIKQEGKEFEGVIWLCDQCGDVLNNQKGFTDENDTWKCEKCGFTNSITEDDIEDSGKDTSVPKAFMNVSEAQYIRDKLSAKNSLTEDEEFLLIEALEFLIATTRDAKDMLLLGGIHYEQRRFELALKYYEMAASYEDVDALSGLGYIWYYGRTGEVDYKKAFQYFSRAAKAGDIISEYKVADMYQNGYFVEKDYDKYVEMIEKLAERVQNANRLGEPLPEIYTRLAKIRSLQGNPEEAVELYLSAKDFLAQRIKYNAFFGNLNIMRGLISELYQLIEFDPDGFDIFDLYYLLKEPQQVQFRYKKKTYTVTSLIEDEICVINFGEHWYRTIEDFMQKAMLDNVLLVTLNQELYLFRVV